MKLPNIPIFLEHRGGQSPVIEAMVHRTRAAREQGLQNIRYMPSGWGALFVFPTAEYPAITMRNTYLALDILFANEHGVVHTVHRNVPPHSQRLWRGVGPSKYVLELPAGVYQLRPGMVIKRADMLGRAG